jgi:hypothetical protein
LCKTDMVDIWWSGICQIMDNQGKIILG